MDEAALVHPGNSAEQRAAEAVLLQLLAAKLGVEFVAGRRVMPDGTRVELDAIAEDPPVLVEAWAHRGPPKSAHGGGNSHSAYARVLGSDPALFVDRRGVGGCESVGLHRRPYRPHAGRSLCGRP